MKMSPRASVSFIIIGLLMLLTAFDNAFFIPWYVKLIGGFGIVTFGVVKLIQSRIEEGDKVFSWKTIPAAFFLIAIIVGGYYYLAAPEHEKHYEKLNGTFTVPFSGLDYPGTASLEGEKLIFQFRVPGTAIQVNDIAIFIQDSTIKKESIEWTMALTRDFHVVRGTTGLNALTEFKELFYDHDFFTVRFDFKEPLNVDRMDKISLAMHTNRGDKKIVIREVPKTSP